MKMKVCFKCGRRRRLYNFYKHSKMGEATMQIIIDVETIPCQPKEPSDFKEKIKVPTNYKKSEAIEKYDAISIITRAQHDQF